MTHWRKLFIITTALFAWALIAATQPPTLLATPPTDGDAHNPIIIAIDSDSPPLSYIGESGVSAGFFVDLWKLWSDRTGHPVRFFPATPEIAKKAILSGRADMHGNLVPTPVLRTIFNFERPLYQTSIHLYTPSSHGPPNDTSALEGYEIGVLHGSATFDKIKATFPNARITPFPSREAMILAANEGRLGAFADSSLIVQSLLSDLGLLGEFTKSPKALFDETFHPAIPKSSGVLDTKVRHGLDKITTADLAAIERKWIFQESHRNFTPRPHDIGLTEQEKRWLGLHPRIRVAFAPEIPPITFTSKDGTTQGMLHDFLANISGRLGITFELMPTASAPRLVAAGKADIAAIWSGLLTDGGSLLHSEPFMVLDNALIIRDDKTRLKSMKDLLKGSVAVVSGSPLEIYLRTNYPKHTFITVPDILSGLEFVSSGAALALAGNIAEAGHTITKHAFSDLRIAFTLSMAESYRFGIRTDWPEFQSILNKTIAATTAEEKQAIRDKWLDERRRWHPGPTSIVVASGIIIALAISLFWNRKLTQEIHRHSKTASRLRQRADSDALVKEIALHLVQEDYHSAMDEILPLIGEFMRADRCRIVEFKPDGVSLSLKHEWCAKGAPSLREVIEGKHISHFPILQKAIEENRALSIRNTSGIKNGPEYQAQLVNKFGIHSLIHIPMRINEQKVGSICIDSSRPDIRWTEDDMNLLTLIGEFLVIAGAKYDAELQLIISRDRYVRATKAAEEGLWDFDLLSGKAFMSTSFWRSLGYSPDSIPQDLQTWFSFMHPSDKKRIRHRVRTLSSASPTIDETYRIRTHSGGYRWIQSRGMVVEYTANEQPRRITGTHIDVTIQKQSERDLRLAQVSLESAYDGIAWVRPDGSLIFTNQALADLMGYSRWELLSFGIQDLNPQFAEKPWQTLWQELEASSPATFESLLKTKHGTVFPIEISTHFSNYEGQDFLNLSIRDISRRKKNEQQIESSRQRFKSLYEHAPIGIILFDNEGNVKEGNPRALELLAFEEEEFQGMPPSRFMKVHDWEAFMENIEAIQSGMTWRANITFLRKDGEPVFVDTSTRQADSTTMQMMVRDMTAYKIMEQDLISAKDDANAANHAKSVFLANISHELRTPMNGVLGMAGLLAGTTLDPTQQEYVASIQQSGETLLNAIDDLLVFTQIESRRVTLIAEPFSLRDCLLSTLQPYSFLAASKGLTMDINIGRDVPDALLGDAKRLSQILANLASNAVKFTKDGNISIKVYHAPTSQTPHTLTFVISDTGIGIDVKQQETVFESFRQADDSSTRTYGGAGLGLTIATELVNLMGGKLELTSSPGNGSSFSFTLSFDPSPVNIHTAPAESRTLLHGKRGLIFSPSRARSRHIQALLEQLGIPARIAKDENHAISMLKDSPKDRRIDVVFIEHTPKQFKEMRMAERIRLLDRYSAVPLVLLVDTADLSNQELKDTFDLLLPKELRAADLTDTLSKLFLNQDPLPQQGRRKLRSSHCLNILLVEDTEINRNVAQNLLRQFGHISITASNGQEALDAFNPNTFDIVLMDVQMPVMDGIEATRRIRAKEAQSSTHTPIIAMTAHVMEEDREAILSSGMDDFVAKPIRPEDLFHALERNAKSKTDAPADSPEPTPSVAEGASPRDAGPYELDFSRLNMSFGDNKDFLRENIEIFRKEIPVRLSEIRKSLSEEDNGELAKQAHAFKGTLGYFDEGEAFQDAYRLERAAGENDKRAAQSAYATLSESAERLVKALETLL